MHAHSLARRGAALLAALGLLVAGCGGDSSADGTDSGDGSTTGSTAIRPTATPVPLAEDAVADGAARVTIGDDVFELTIDGCLALGTAMTGTASSADATVEFNFIDSTAGRGALEKPYLIVDAGGVNWQTGKTDDLTTAEIEADFVDIEVNADQKWTRGNAAFADVNGSATSDGSFEFNCG